MGSDIALGKAAPTGSTRIAPRPPEQTKPHKVRSAPLYMFFAVQGGDPAEWAGSRYLGLTKLQGQESISSPFEYQLELHANTEAANPAGARESTTTWPSMGSGTQDVWELDFDQILGRLATVGLAQPTAAWPASDNGHGDADIYHQNFVPAVLGSKPAENLSLFNGVIASFSMASAGVYHATLRPSLWLLTLSNGYRIIEGNFATAVGSVLERHGIERGTLGTDPSGAEYYIPPGLGGDVSQDWLQAGESDYAFVQRLMTKFNVYYYFEHGPRGHRVVFSNTPQYAPVSEAGSVLPTAPGSTDAAPDTAMMRYRDTDESALGSVDRQSVTTHRYQRSLGPTGLRVDYVRPQAVANVESVATYRQALAGSAGPGSGGSAAGRPFHLHRMFAEGGSDEGNEDDVQVQHLQQQQMLRGHRATLSGASISALFRAGRWFEMTSATVSGAPRPRLDGKRFVLKSVKHQAALNGEYHNSFQATEWDALVTPFTMGATHQGSILGTVVDTPPGQSAFRARRFLPKTAFAPNNRGSDSADRGASSNASSGGEDMLRGVYVALCTAQTDSSPVWVKLSDRMSTVPQVGALVSVGRARDECEIPELQEVIDSHGSMTVTPPGARELSWRRNASVGSNYSTSYGDSQSVRYGASSPGATDINDATHFVTKAYRTPEALAKSGGTALVAAESIAAVAKALGATASRDAAAGQPPQGSSDEPPTSDKRSDGHAGGASLLEPTAKLLNSDREKTKPSPGKLDEQAGHSQLAPDDVSFSQGSSCSFSESNDGPDGLLSRSMSRGSNWSSHIGASSISYSITGSRESRTAHKDAIQPKSFQGVVSGSQDWTFGDSEHASVTYGDVTGSDEVHGNSTNTSTHYGNQTSTTTVQGDVTDVTTHLGTVTSFRTTQAEISVATGTSQVNASTHGSVTSTSTVGTEVSDRNVGSSTSTSEVGEETSNRTVGVSTSTSEVGEETSNRTVGVSTSTSEIGEETSNRTVGVSTSTSKIGAETSNRTVGVSTSTSGVGEETSNSSGMTRTRNDEVLNGFENRVCVSKEKNESSATSTSVESSGSHTGTASFAEANTVHSVLGGVSATTDERPAAITSGATVEIPETKVIM